jgi:DNA invertase Pin-like site-specific DNA recombinase
VTEAAIVIRAAIYCRISRAFETMKGVERQLQDAIAIARAKGWTVADDSVYIDNNTGASEFSNKARAEYLRMLADIEAGKYDAVILWLEDRGHRRVIDAWEFVQLCKTHNVTVYITSQDRNYDFTDPLDEAEFYGNVAKAQRETALVSRRLRRQRQQVAEAGEPHPGGMRHFGFQGYRTRTVPEDQLGLERSRIQEAVARVIAGDTVRGIVLDWNKRGIPTATGGQWTRGSLRRVLTSPALVGLRKHNGSLYPATWEPVVARKDWDEVRAILKDPTRVMTRGRGPAYLLTGLVYCGVCGERMRVKLDSKGMKYYRCENYRPDAKLPRLARLVKFVDGEVTARLLYRLTSPQVEDAAKALHGEGGNVGEQITDILAELARLQAQYDRVGDKAIDELAEDVDEGTRRQVLKAAQRRRERLEHEMDRLREKYTQLTGKRILTRLPPNIAEVWPDLSLDRQRAILAAVIERVVIQPSGPTGFGHEPSDPDSISVLWRDRTKPTSQPEQ